MLARRAGVLFERLFRQGTIAGLGESDLLARFVSDRDEAAFAALVDRHGPMVLGVCRRLLRDDRDAEDAFQATFLVLARRAGAIRDGDRLGGWLHGVARKVAVRAKARRIRRGLLETNAVDPDTTPSKHPPNDPDNWKGILDDELARLPETQRIPLVLCYLEGMTHDEAASRLGWPVGTVRSRMARGRDRLRGRLSQRGVDAETPMTLAPVVPPALLEATVSVALNYTTPSIFAGTAASAAVLANGSLHAMMLSKSTTIALAGVAAAAALVGGPLLARQMQGAGGTVSVQKSIDKLQADLVETARRNAQMQQELQILRHELESLRGAGGEPTPVAGMPGAAGSAGGAGMMSGGGSSSGFAGDATGMMPGMGSSGRGMGTARGASPKSGRAARLEGMSGMGGMPGGSGMGMMGGGGEGGGMPGMMGGRGMMMSGGMAGPGGMAAMIGGGGEASPQHYRVFNDWLLVISPSGDRATMYEPNTGKTRPIRLGDEHQAPVNVQPVVAAGLLVLRQDGPKITRTAVFVESEAAWYIANFKEAVESTSPTIVDGKTALVETADHLYLWNGAAKRWDLQALPHGTSRPGFRQGSSISSVAYETEGHIYKYDFEKAKWVDIDTRDLLGKEENDGDRPGEDPKPK